MHKEEEKYFKAANAKLRERLRRRLHKAAKLSGERKAIRPDEHHSLTIVERIEALGFDDDTDRVFDLLPLIHVAWADGSVSYNERKSIMDAVTSRGISDESEAYHVIETLLEQRPSAEFLEETLSILHDLFEENDARVRRIVDLCLEVARASGGFLGLGNKVSGEEKDLIQHIADVLGPAAKREFEIAIKA